MLRKFWERLTTAHKSTDAVQVYGDAAVLCTLAIEVARDVFTFGLIAGFVFLLVLLVT